METIQQITKDTPIAMMTLGQLEEHLTTHLTEHMKTALFPQPLLDILDKQVQLEEKKSRRYEHGVAGIRRIFNCSYPTAHKLKETIIKDAVLQQGRVIMVDVDLALKLFQESKTAHSIKEL
jgi:hypothetical protein